MQMQEHNANNVSLLVDKYIFINIIDIIYELRWILYASTRGHIALWLEHKYLWPDLLRQWNLMKYDRLANSLVRKIHTFLESLNS